MILQTVQTGSGSQAQEKTLEGSFASNICIVGDGAEAIALAGLVSSNVAAQDAVAYIRLLGGVTPPHIELASAGLNSTMVADASPKSHLQGQQQAQQQTNHRVSSPVNIARYYPESEIQYSLKSRDVEECLDHANAVVISGPATAYSAIAKALAPSLTDGITIAIAGAPLLGAWQFGQELKSFRPDLIVNLVELDWLFNHAQSSPDGVAVLGLRRRVNLSGRSRNEIRRALPLACTLSPGLLPASNMLERGFLDAESVVRPVFILSALLGSRIEALGDLSTLLNRSNLAMLAEIEQEISRLSFSYKCALADFARALREESYCQVNFEPQDIVDDEQCYEATLAEALVGISGEWFKGLDWSHRMAQEVLARYVSDHLVLLSDLARLANVPTPVLDGVISISSALLGFDLRNRARGLNHLHLSGLSQNELLELVNS
ncbi:hypothetical protein BH11CYA1_BH11CYA1_36510 [soil metagenome]